VRESANKKTDLDEEKIGQEKARKMFLLSTNEMSKLLKERKYNVFVCMCL